jgi:crotonobetainyl-CoA:carnitine CoA-transferase CaiB-like acyl-CoA transferase
MAQPLEALRVVELAGGVAGAYTAKLFADFGADVVKVEPPHGCPTRRLGPDMVPDVGSGVGPGPGIDGGALHCHLDTSKRSVVADLETTAGQDLVRALARGADAVIESSRPGFLAARRLGLDDLRRQQPALVVTSITPFGQDGPYAQRLGGDIVTYAMAGPMHATGVQDREPVKLGGQQTTYQCGTVAAVATLAAVLTAQVSGTGIHVDLSAFEAQAASIDRRATYLLFHQFSGQVVQREPAGRQNVLPVGMYPTLDGHVQILTIPSWAGRMAECLGDPELIARYQRPDWPTDEDLPDLLDAVLYPWLLTRTRAEAAAEAQRHRWAVTPLNAPVDLLDDQHFEQRHWWVDVAQPGGSDRHPGPPIRMEGAWRISRPPPALGQHQQEVEAEAAPAPAKGAAPAGDSAVSAAEGVGGRHNLLPLEGIRVLDLTVVWAGPAVTMHLGDLGAEVIRVDNPYVFPTATRGHAVRPPTEAVAEMGPLAGSYPHLDPGERPWNRHGMFAAHARNKLSCTLDLRTELGLQTFMRLVDVADVLVENNSVHVVDHLGIGWEGLHARNPRLVMLRMPPMGLHGPYSGWLGFGAHFEALCGMTALRGYRDGDVSALLPVFHMDPASGAGGAFAVLCALRRRERTGRGELVELAQSENMLQHIGEYLLDAARTGRRHRSMGNRDHARAPQGCYRCAGQDRWVVISVGDDDQWDGLCKAMGTPAWVGDERFRSAAGRHAYHDEIDAGIEDWTAELTPHQVFEACQEAGVPAGPVLDEADLLADPHMAARGFFRDQGSPDLGTWRFPGHPWRWDGPAMRFGAINQLGQDNEYVYRHVLGMSEREYAALVDAGHIQDAYVDADGRPL